jgi:hypothetical protein
MYKNIFSSIHKKTLHHRCCSLKYPWGWMPPNDIQKLVDRPEIKMFWLQDKYREESYFYEPEFCDGSTMAYETIYNLYKNKGNFLHFQYTSPSLSLVLNTLSLHSSVNDKERIMDVKILDTWLEEEYTYKNNKVLGLLNETEIRHLLISGMIGPEVSHIWLQKPIKQVVKVHFLAKNRQDVWLFERCLLDEEMNWQVKNINGILIY